MVLARESAFWEHLRQLFTKQMYQEPWNEAEECCHTISVYPLLAPAAWEMCLPAVIT